MGRDCPQDPLGLSNWQTTQKTAFEIRNKTGATCSLPQARWRGESKPGKSAPFPCRFAASAQPCQRVR